MAFIINTQPLINAYQQLISDTQGSKHFLTGMLGQLDDGKSVSWDQMLNVLSNFYHLYNKFDSINKTEPRRTAINLFVQDQLNDDSYDFVTEVEALMVLIDAVRTAMAAEVPRTGNVLNIYTIDGDGNRNTLAFNNGDIPAIRLALDAYLSALV